MSNITPEKEAQIEENSTPETKTEDWEKRYKDTQASFTKAQQTALELAKNLVETDPKNITKIPDAKVQKKILEEKWGVETIGELETLYPDYDKSEEEKEEDQVSQLEKKVRLLEYSQTKGRILDEINRVKDSRKEITNTIPDFEDKIKEELKYISSDLSPRERVERAFKLVAGSSSSAFAYGALQGTTTVKAHSSSDNKNENKRRYKGLFKNKMV